MHQSENYLLVSTGSNETWQTLARQFLGSASLASNIEQLNSGARASSSIVSIPLKPLNASAVYADGYQVVPILCYHQFREGADTSSPMQVSSQSFDAQMAYLANNDYQVIAFSQLEDFLSGNRPIPPKSVVITIDDGYKSVYQTAYPILKKYGFRATLFLYTDFVGGGAALSWNTIAEMQQSGLMDIESHSRTHTSLARNPSETSPDYSKRIVDEVVVPEKLIQRKLDHKTKHYAYPFGDTSDLVVEVLQNHSYLLAATVQRGSNAAFSPPLLLRRNMIYASDDLAKFRKQLKVFHTQDLR